MSDAKRGTCRNCGAAMRRCECDEIESLHTRIRQESERAEMAETVAEQNGREIVVLCAEAEALRDEVKWLRGALMESLPYVGLEAKRLELRREEHEFGSPDYQACDEDFANADSLIERIRGGLFLPPPSAEAEALRDEVERLRGLVVRFVAYFDEAANRREAWGPLVDEARRLVEER